jgi:long-chain acyl-CoA synthetase
MEIGADDVVLAPLPLPYHCVASALSFIRAGAALIDVADQSPAEMVRRAAELKATLIYASPVQYEQLSRACAGPGRWLPTVRRAFSTSALLTPSVAERFHATFGVRLTQVYGLIEVGLPLWNDESQMPITALGGCRKPYRAMVADDDGRPVPDGEAGELLVSGPGLFSGYLCGDDAGVTQQRDAWFRTGDIVVVDSRGVFTFLGRKKTVINCGGNKVFPEEVEEVLSNFEAIAAARVRAEEDSNLGAVIVAEIVLKTGQREDSTAWQQRCAALLSSYKVPREFRVVQSLPMTGSGKVARHSR